MHKIATVPWAPPYFLRDRLFPGVCMAFEKTTVLITLFRNQNDTNERALVFYAHSMDIHLQVFVFITTVFKSIEKLLGIVCIVCDAHRLQCTLGTKTAHTKIGRQCKSNMADNTGSEVTIKLYKMLSLGMSP